MSPRSRSTARAWRRCGCSTIRWAWPRRSAIRSRAVRPWASTNSPTSRFVTAREGHWLRRLLDRLFAARGLTPKIVCESDEHSAIADLIGAGLGIGLVPSFARRLGERAPVAWIPVDSPDCRRTVTLCWGAGSHLSTAARLMRSTITGWDWGTGEPA